MQRIRNLNTYQKVILLILAAMLVLSCPVYLRAASQEGYEYKDEVFLPSYENGKTVYSGRLYGADCSFTVTSDKVVSFRCEEKYYGPYTAEEDTSAIPEEYSGSPNATGVELRDNGRLLFRGCILKQEHGIWLIDEDGELFGITVIATMSDGTQVDENGNVIDPWEPSVYTILELMGKPELTAKGEWGFWFLGLILSIITAVSILFADELFRLSLSFRVYNAEYIEPSDWEIAGRYISWTILTIMALVVTIMGLQ